jgi:hypothetical protein
VLYAKEYQRLLPFSPESRDLKVYLRNKQGETGQREKTRGFLRSDREQHYKHIYLIDLADKNELPSS